MVVMLSSLTVTTSWRGLKTTLCSLLTCRSRASCCAQDEEKTLPLGPSGPEPAGPLDRGRNPSMFLRERVGKVQ